jgi:hypothetical protein
MKHEFWDKFSKNIQVSKFMKIIQLRDEIFHTDRRTDMMNLIVVFRDFVNSPEKESSQSLMKEIYLLQFM